MQGEQSQALYYLLAVFKKKTQALEASRLAQARFQDGAPVGGPAPGLCPLPASGPFTRQQAG